MKLHFEPNLDYQWAAINAVCDLFKGQTPNQSLFTVTRDTADQQQRMGFAENDLGIGNRLTLLDDELLANLNDIQLRNGLPPSTSLASGDFTVEMETGTGKTYVYLRTVFELLLKLGLDLTVPIETRTIAGQQVHSIGAGTLLVCLSKSIAAKEVEPLALGIATWHKTQAPAGESTIVFRDSAFADDVAKTNLTAIIQQHGLQNVRSL